MAGLQYNLPGLLVSQPGRASTARRGFTLLEILLVLALIGILAAILVVSSTGILTPRARSAEQIFWHAVEEARRAALLQQADVQLSYDRETRSFTARIGRDAQTFPVPGEGELQIDFLSPQRSGGTVLIGGTLMETQPLRGITFFADGTCTPFRAQLRQGASVQVVAVDPWTCAPMLEAEPTS